MLSYKEYKMLNESLYGAINLGIKQPSILTQPVGATGATEVVEAEVIETEEGSENSLEEAKCGKGCGKMMKKGMKDEDHKEEKDEDHDEKEKEKDHDEDEKEDKDGEDEEKDNDHDADSKGLTAAQKKLPPALQKAILKKKKGSKKEWSEIVSDVESLLEGKDQSVVEQVMGNLENIKKILEAKEMTEEEKAWWTSVNSQLAQPGDMGFAPVGKIIQAIR